MTCDNRETGRTVETVPEVGAKTAESLRGIGIETAAGLAAAYLRGDEVVRDTLHRSDGLTQAIVEEEIDVTGADIGVHGVDAAPAAVAFARQFGAGNRFLKESHGRFDDPTDTAVVQIDWDAGVIADEATAFGLVYDEEGAVETLDAPLDRVRSRPVTVTVEEEVVTFRLGRAATSVGVEYIETAEQFTGRDYTTPENVRIHPARTHLLRLCVGCSGAYLLVAPRVDAEGT